MADRMPFRHQRWGLQARLIAVVLLALLPIAGLLGFLWLSARERDLSDSLGKLVQTTEAVAVIADDLFDEALAVGRAVATDPQVRTLDPAQFVPRLQMLHAQLPRYTNIIVMDAGGMILGWSAPAPLPEPAPILDARPFFQRAVTTQQPSVIRVVESHAPAEPGSGVAVPIMAPDGGLLGIVAITFDLEQVSQRLAQIQLYPGQSLSLIDPNGRVAVLNGRINRRTVDLTWEQRDRSAVPEVQAALAGEEVTSRDYRSQVAAPGGGQQRLAAFVPTLRHGWVVAITWPVAEALGAQRQAELRELLIFGAIVLVILAGAAFASRSILVPLRRLSEHTRRLGDGEFVPIPQRHAADELGELTDAFNVMGGRLQQTLDDLRRERSLLEMTLNQLPVGVVIRSASGDLLRGNTQAEAIWRFPCITGSEADRATPGRGARPDGTPYLQGEWPISRSLKTGEVVRREPISIQRGDNTTGEILVSSAPIRDGTGKIIAAVTSFDDVTEQRRTEALHREREELLRGLLDQFPASVAVMDRDLRYVLAAGRRFLEVGLPPADLVGRSLGELYSAQLVAAAEEHARRAFAGETVTYDITEQGVCLQVTMLPLRDAHSEIHHILTVSLDVTTEREQQARAALDEKLHALGQMAGGIAHNLNQTLSLVSGYGELARDVLDREFPDHQELHSMIRIIGRAAYDGGETVKRLLTFARGHGSERRQIVDVAALLHEVQQLTAPRWRDAARLDGCQITLVVDTEADLSVSGSPADLREAITNLVLNAVDAMPYGGTIRLSARRSGSRVLIDVADTGLGMLPETRQRIFEPFFTTKGEQGTGLGLAMVFGIVRRHHGHIEVTSELGQGTTMHIWLPIAVPTAEDGQDASQTPLLRSLRVLVVDDEARLAMLAAAMLRRDGHEVTEAHSGEAALACMRAQPFDMVISDLSMGDGMNGWDLAAAAAREAPGIPVVLATGWGAAIDEADARQRGVCAVLAKPFRITDLRDVMARVLIA